jgi:hypothetical protein
MAPQTNEIHIKNYIHLAEQVCGNSLKEGTKEGRRNKDSEGREGMESRR